MRRDAEDPALLRSYEGLVFRTATLIVGDLRARGVLSAEDDLDDIRQLLRIKIYRTLLLYDPAKLRFKKGESIAEARDRYVFMGMRDKAKDILKKKRPAALMIEDLAPAKFDVGGNYGGELPDDGFHARYLAQSQEETFAAVEVEPPVMPASLSSLERRVLVLLYRDYTHREIAERLGISKGVVETAVRGLRVKLSAGPASARRLTPAAGERGEDAHAAS